MIIAGNIFWQDTAAVSSWLPQDHALPLPQLSRKESRTGSVKTSRDGGEDEVSWRAERPALQASATMAVRIKVKMHERVAAGLIRALGS
jgi:hypothetical protein